MVHDVVNPAESICTESACTRVYLLVVCEGANVVVYFPPSFYDIAKSKARNLIVSYITIRLRARNF